MKLVLTQSEATNIIRSKLGLSSDVTIEISDTTKKTFIFDWSSDDGRFVSNIQDFVNRGDKIGAIRAYRTRMGNGLKEAKDIVEDWPFQVQKIVDTGKIPGTIDSWKTS